MIREAPLCRVLRDFEPAFAGGILPVGSALAETYRVLHWTPDPLWLVLAQNLLLHHVHSRDNIMYTTINIYWQYQPDSSASMSSIWSSFSCSVSAGEGAPAMTSLAA